MGDIVLQLPLTVLFPLPKAPALSATLSCQCPGSRCFSSLGAVSADENSNQSSLSDVYQIKVDSSPNSSPSPQQSESMSPAHTSDFRTDDSQPPTLGQETLEGGCWAGRGGGRWLGLGKTLLELLLVRWVTEVVLGVGRVAGTRVFRSWSFLLAQC